MDDDDQINALEKIIIPELKDLSVEYSDDEHAHEELQPLITSVPFPVVVNNRATNNLQHNTRNEKSSRSQLQSAKSLRNHIPMTQAVINK